MGREKVREYARAVGETNPLHLDLDAARAAGYDDVVAPPMFAVVYAMPAVAAGMFDPEVGIDFARLVHAGQEFAWGPLVVAGDEISTIVSVKDVSERRGAASSSSSRCPRTSAARRSAPAPGRTSAGRLSVELGGEIEPLSVTPDRYLTVRYAGASGDFNPIHIDEQFAQQVGLPGRILHGLYTMAQVARAVTDAGGGPQSLRSLSVQFRGMGVPERSSRSPAG